MNETRLPWLRTSGPDVVQPDGTPVRLRGVGIGGWLNMENFITGYPATESSHRQAMRAGRVRLAGNNHLPLATALWAQNRRGQGPRSLVEAAARAWLVRAEVRPA